MKLVMRMSAASTSRRKASLPAATRRSMATLRLPRLHARKYGPRRSSQEIGSQRAWSPTPGSSTLVTLAPIWPRRAAACGPCTRRPASTTRTPRRAPSGPLSLTAPSLAPGRLTTKGGGRHDGAMRAAVVTRFGPPEVIEVRQVDEPPDPGPDQVRLRVEATGVNPVDAKLRQGLGVLPPEVSLPYVTGREAAGVVLDADAASGCRPGGPVLGFFRS